MIYHKVIENSLTANTLNSDKILIGYTNRLDIMIL